MELIKRLYTPMYHVFGGDEMLIGTIVSYLYMVVVFWLMNVPLLVADLTGKPQWLRKYKVQKGKNEPVDRVMLMQVVKRVAFNNLFLNLIFCYHYYIIKRWGGMKFHPSEVTSLQWFIVELAVYTLVQEVIFYYTHRLIHHPWLYKSIHKLHHQWTAPIGLVSIYATPIEYVLGNTLSVIMGPVLMGSHITSAWLWYFLAFFYTTMHHSGYHIPFLPSPQFHDYHHLTFNWNFGTIGLFDWLHSTDEQFRQSVQGRRHRFMAWLTPMHEVYPEK